VTAASSFYVNDTQTGASVFINPTSAGTAFAIGNGAGVVNLSQDADRWNANARSFWLTGLSGNNANESGIGFWGGPTGGGVYARGSAGYGKFVAFNIVGAIIVSSNGNVAIGPDSTYSANDNTRLDVQGLGSFTSGVSIGGVAPISGLTSFVAFASGVSPVGSMTEGGIIYATSGQLWVNGTAGDHTQITPHDPETGEIYTNSYNVYTGNGEKYYPKSGRLVTYMVDKVNPEIQTKELWIKGKMAKATTEVTEDPFIEVDNEIDGQIVDLVTRYEAKDGKIIAKQDRKVTQIKTKLGTKKVLKPDHVLNTDTGKVYRKPTRAEAEKGQFVFDWTTMPKFVRDAWGK